MKNQTIPKKLLLLLLIAFASGALFTACESTDKDARSADSPMKAESSKKAEHPTTEHPEHPTTNAPPQKP